MARVKRRALFVTLTAVIALMGLAFPAVVTADVPCRFFGSVQFSGENVPDGTVITAWLEDPYRGPWTAATFVYSGSGLSVYRLDVDPALLGGAYEGDTVRFGVTLPGGSSMPAPSATWTNSGGAFVWHPLYLSGPAVPVADFSGTPRTCCAPLEVHFTDLSSGVPTSWEWDFGDGSPHSFGQNPIHTYTQPSTGNTAVSYSVSLTATNALGFDTETKIGYVTVHPPLKADFSATPKSGQLSLSVSFTDLSTGTITSWDWNFGDGSPHSSLQNPSHTYAAGTYNVALTITGHGGSKTMTKQNYIYVAGAEPHIDSLSPNEGPVDARVVISGSGFGPTQGASTVTFGGVNAHVSSWSDAQIVVWVPEGTGSNVVVHTTQGDSNAVSFTATDSPVDYWAVIVGVEDYPGTEDDLDHPNEDAWDVHDALLAGFNWEEGHITMLLDSDATKANIHNAITQMGNNGDGNDLFFFHYSGHGNHAADRPPIDESDGLDEYLAQYDYATDPIWDDEFAQWLAVLPGRKVAVSLDACYSGGQVRGSGGGVGRYMAAVGVSARGDGFARDIDDIIGGVALTASAEDEGSWELEKLQNGLYTYYFVEGLGGLADSNADGEISMEEAFNYLDPLVSGYSVSEPQNPQMYDGYPGELVILLSEPNNPPSTPSNPSPPNHATSVSVNHDLSWTGGDPNAGDTVTYDVYFGTSWPAPFKTTIGPYAATQSSITHDPGPLMPGTTYYWRIVARDNHCVTTEGSAWDFTTGVVVMSVEPTSEKACIGGTFTVDIKVTNSGGAGVTAAGAHVDFNPIYLEVLSITPGTALGNQLQNDYHNTAGTIDYEAGVGMGNPPVTDDFVLATVEFQVKATMPVEGTPLTFVFAPVLRQTAIYVGVDNVLDPAAAINGNVVIEVCKAALDGNVDLQGRPAAPHASWITDLAVTFLQGGAVVRTENVTTDNLGDFTIPDVDSGTYDICVKCPRALSELATGVEIAEYGTAYVDFGILREGDVNNDDAISLGDYALLYAAYGSAPSDGNWNGNCDFNRNEAVDLGDYALLYANYGQAGDCYTA